MKSRTIYDQNGQEKMKMIEIDIAGTGAEQGQAYVKNVIEMIEEMKTRKTREEVKEIYTIVCGYLLCCYHHEYLDEKSLDDMTEVITMIANMEAGRADRERAEGRV